MNQHYDDARLLISEAALTDKWGHEESSVTAIRAHATATLALAYEQRTANLLAFFASEDITDTSTHCIDYRALADQIEERLGLA